MASIDPSKKRKATPDPASPPDHDDPRTAHSLADLNRLIDQRVSEVVETKTLGLTARVDDLQRENEGLLLRCKSLERSVQVLKKEGGWTYSAPDVPSSHWADQGHDEAYANDADFLVQSIKGSVQGLRSASSSEVDVKGGTPPTLSDNVLNPHWEQLANAIQLSERITTLNLQNIQLDQRTLQMIEESVRQKGIAKFYLTRNQFIEGEGVQFAINVLKSNRLVQLFGWGKNFISTADACKLIDTILEHPTISNVGFIGTLNGGVIPYTPVQHLFGRLGADSLLNVNLSGNGIKTNGDRCIPDFLSANPPLEWLNLQGNKFTDDDALHIAQALQSNTNLRLLNLAGNLLTNTGKLSLYKKAILGLGPSEFSGLMSVTEADLNIVSGANHTCQIDGICRPKMFMNRSNQSAKLNRAQKLFLLLRKRRREGCSITLLESEFSEEGMRLVPHVLACVNAYAKGCFKRRCLSVLFELVRNWKTPEIYQFH